MSQHTITSVIQGDLFSVLLYIEGQRVDLNYNGSDTYRSTNTVNISGALNVVLVARGVSPAAWRLTITEGANQLVNESGQIGPGNVSTFATSVPVAQALSASKKGGASKKSAKKGGK